MSLSNNIDHLARTPGVEAVVVQAEHREYRGNESWYGILDGALDLFKRTNEPTIKLTCGKHTITVQKEEGETVAVALPTGHPTSKSLRRLIRRMAKRDRGPATGELPANQSAQ